MKKQGQFKLAQLQTLCDVYVRSWECFLLVCFLKKISSLSDDLVCLMLGCMFPPRVLVMLLLIVLQSAAEGGMDKIAL